MTEFNPDELTLEDDGLTLEGDELTLDLDGDGLGGSADKRGYSSDVPGVREAEETALAEVSDLLAGFKERAANETERFDDATDSEYWFCICFQTRDQKDEFLTKVGWMEIGDKYLDGMLVAEVMGIKLEARIPPMPRADNVDRRLSMLASDRLDGQGVPPEATYPFDLDS